MEKCLIVAVADNWGIGIKNQLPWHIAEDLKYFKATTKGFPVIMGRTTYFSLPFRPLKGRKNIVLNLGGDPIPEVTCVYSFEEAYREAEAAGKDKCFIIGGASVYKMAMPEMDLQYCLYLAAFATGKPHEFFDQLKARDAVKVKNKIRNCFFVEE